MADKVLTGRISRRKRGRHEDQKLPALPADAHVTKRPLLRPALPSPYTGASQQKVVYVSAKTPFISAVKRVEKLLHLGDRRLVQSATQRSKDANKQKRRSDREDDAILGIAREVENAKARGSDDERVVLKGTGKAISKVLELGLWFQLREEYCVSLRTGSVSAVDDVHYQEDRGHTSSSLPDASHEGDALSTKPVLPEKPASRIVKREERPNEAGKTEVDETRIRQLSVLEVYVELR